jgi:uncharacterized membrane protein YgcG
MSAASDAVRGVFLGNLGTKFVALLVAVGLWFYIGKELTGVEVFHAELSIELSEDIRQDWRILDKPVRRVRVTLEGPAKMIDTLRGREGEVLKGRAVIDATQLGVKSALTDGGKTTVSLPLREAFFQPLPYVALSLKGMEPASVTVELGALVTKELEVDLARLTKETLEKGVPEDRNVEVRVSRNRVKVRGPSETINALGGKLPLAPIPLEDADGNIIEQGRLHPSIEAAHIAWATKARPTVTVLITPKAKKRTLQVEVRKDYPNDLVIPPNTEWKQMDKTVLVEIEGPADEVDRVTPAQLIVRAEMPADLPLGPNFAQALARLEAGFRRQTDRPPNVFVRVAGNDELSFQVRLAPAEEPEKPPGDEGDGKDNGGSGDNGGSSGGGGSG